MRSLSVDIAMDIARSAKLFVREALRPGRALPPERARAGVGPGGREDRRQHATVRTVFRRKSFAERAISIAISTDNERLEPSKAARPIRGRGSVLGLAGPPRGASRRCAHCRLILQLILPVPRSSSSGKVRKGSSSGKEACCRKGSVLASVPGGGRTDASTQSCADGVPDEELRGTGNINNNINRQ